MGCFGVTVAGWFAWCAFLAGVYPLQPSPYAGRRGLFETFGRDPVWWLTGISVCVVLICVEMAYKTIKRNLIIAGWWWLPPWKHHVSDASCEKWNLEIWQELELDPAVRANLRRILREEEGEDNERMESRSGVCAGGFLTDLDEETTTTGDDRSSRAGRAVIKGGAE